MTNLGPFLAIFDLFLGYARPFLAIFCHFRPFSAIFDQFGTLALYNSKSTFED